MSSLPHPVPSRIAQNIAALFGHEDDTLIAWQRFCVQAAEALHTQHDGERLTKALALAQDGQVVVADGGVATVTSGANHYTVQADGACDCPDYAKRGAPCKHGLAVLIYVKAQALLAPGASPTPQQAAPPVPAQPTPQGWPPSADRWHVTEAPASCCLRIRVGELELMYTMRDVSDAELTGRVQHLVPWVQDVLDQARERQVQLDALRQPRETAKAAPAVTPPALPPAPTPVPADLQALLQQAVQQALAAANGAGHGTPPPAAPSTGAAANGAAPPPPDGWCTVHQVQMERRQNERGSWYSHWLPDAQRHCKGRR